MAPSERKAYTNAVLCLQSKPSKFAPGVVPGAKTRYDDFLAVHMNQTLVIHGTVCFQLAFLLHVILTYDVDQFSLVASSFHVELRASPSQ